MFRVGGGHININDNRSTSSSTTTGLAEPFQVVVSERKQSGISFVQYLKPLNPAQPCFYVKLDEIGPEGCVTLGIANSDINENASPGSCNNSIGYESRSGRCISSHRNAANTFGRPVQSGDTFGLYVTHFGQLQSTVVFLLNGQPVATRYLFEQDQKRFLPTISFENGPIKVTVNWPDDETIQQAPILTDWIKPADDSCKLTKNESGDEFENLSNTEDMPVQSPVALSKAVCHYKCVQLEIFGERKGASVGLASCSPLKPTPTSSLLRDYYTWLPHMKLKAGDSIGWGIFYNPDFPELNDKAEQLVLVFVTYNETIVDLLFLLQPEGGLFPLVLLQPWGKRVKLSMEKTLSNDYQTKLTKYFNSKLGPALEIYKKDLEESTIKVTDILSNSGDISVKVEKTKTVIKIPKGGKSSGLHIVQYQKPLTPELRFFFIELISVDKSSNVVIGVAPSSILDQKPLKLPGRIQDTIGYESKSGSMYFNNKYKGNMMGHKCSKGDSMAIEMEVFETDMSVAIFSKNFKPVGTRFLTLNDPEQFLPTVAIQNSGSEDIELNIYWHTVISNPPHFNVRNPEDWCYPEGTKIDLNENMFLLPNHYDHSLCLQAPYSLHHKYNHFEIVLVDDFDKNNPPPALALCTACPFDPPPLSQFKQDYLRFWPTGEAMGSVKKNDRLGWGIFYADPDAPKDEEQLMICFLTINRQVVYLRVLFQPPGGFYPVVIAPPNVYKIKMDFTATRVSTEDFAGDQIKTIILDANKQIEKEKRMLAQGKNPRELTDDSRKSRLCTVL